MTALAACAAGLLAAESASAATPRTLVEAPVICAFAHDGPRLAWSGGSGCDGVSLRDLRTGATVQLDRGVGSRSIRPEMMAIAGPRTLWAGEHDTVTTNHPPAYLFDAVPGRPARLLADVSGEYGFGMLGTQLTAMAGDSRTLAYAVVDNEQDDRCCTVSTRSGDVRLVDARGARTLRGVGAVFDLSVAGSRLAVVPAARTPRPCPRHLLDECSVWAEPARRVALYDTRTGQQLGTAPVAGRPWAIALSSSTLVAFVETPRGDVLQRFTLPHLEPLRPVPAPARSSQPADELHGAIRDGLDAAGSDVVFASGRRIYRQSTPAQRPRLLFTADSAYSVDNVSLEGRQLVWRETLVDDSGRIRMLLLPR